MKATQATVPGYGDASDEQGCTGSLRPTGFLRKLARLLIYWTGALSVYHRLRNRRTLTVVVFHRVLRRDDPRWETALLPWTIADDTFDRCLLFFSRHYRLVALEDVKASIRGTRPLPPRSLLITFDDGFADSLEYALPLLSKHNARAVIFVTSDVIGRPERLWTDDLLWAFTAGRIGQQDLIRLHALLFDGRHHEPQESKLIWDILRRGPELDQSRVCSALSRLNINLRRVTTPRQMLTRDEIGELVANGVAIGAHGKTHTALPVCSNIAAELRSPRAMLIELAAPHGQASVDALSFPHGVYTPEIVDQALAAGYSMLFTGEARLCALKNGLLITPLIARIEIDGRRIAPNCRFFPERLATLLFTAKRQQMTYRSRTALADVGPEVRGSTPSHHHEISVSQTP